MLKEGLFIGDWGNLAKIFGDCRPMDSIDGTKGIMFNMVFAFAPN